MTKETLKNLSGLQGKPERVDSIQERLNFLMEQAGNPNAFAKQTGLSVSGLKRYLGGGEPTASKIIQIADSIGISAGWLLTGKGKMKEDDTASPSSSTIEEEFELIPGYNVQVSAGHGCITGKDSVPTRHLAFRRKWLKWKSFDSKDLTVVWAKGDSMHPTISDNDTLVVHLGRKEPKDGYIYVFRNGDELFVKRFQDGLGSWKLISDNPIYDKLEIVKEDQHQFEVIGQVVHLAKDIAD
ncbi:XRE family transcriptional regulator [Vibrio splendidus]|jgi:phage repressor protein C with HTH and peptisase S24 domain|uniref:XRE family transcriptional regulator n=1 Tax=Vibrio splendidus TaxID=29497 RepID=UPI002159171A|nr:helix-turn-helix transcriptional regulator [Vibrio splendidus]